MNCELICTVSTVSVLLVHLTSIHDPFHHWTWDKQSNSDVQKLLKLNLKKNCQHLASTSKYHTINKMRLSDSLRKTLADCTRAMTDLLRTLLRGGRNRKREIGLGGEGVVQNTRAKEEERLRWRRNARRGEYVVEVMVEPESSSLLFGFGDEEWICQCYALRFPE